MAMQFAWLKAAGTSHQGLTAVLAKLRGGPVRDGAEVHDPADSYWRKTSRRYVVQGQTALDRLAGLAQNVEGIGLAGALGQLSDADRLASWLETIQAIHEARNVLLRLYAELGAQRATWLDRHGDATSEEADHRTFDVITMAAWLTSLEEVALVEYVGQIVAAGRTPPPSVLGLLAWLDDDDEDPLPALDGPASFRGSPRNGRPERNLGAAELEDLRRTLARRCRFARAVHALIRARCAEGERADGGS
jgi:hypothetical protein